MGQEFRGGLPVWFWLMVYGRMNKVPKDVHVLIPETCDYVHLDGKRNFADVTKLKILR